MKAFALAVTIPAMRLRSTLVVSSMCDSIYVKLDSAVLGARPEPAVARHNLNGCPRPAMTHRALPALPGRTAAGRALVLELPAGLDDRVRVDTREGKPPPGSSPA
jgi:hypothetical protein